MLKFYVKKSVIFTVFLSFLFIFNSSYAQSDDSDVKVYKSSYFIPYQTFGIQSGGYINVGDYLIGHGGGVAIDYKANFHQYMGVQINITYNYGTYKGNNNHMLSDKFLFVF